MAWDFVGTTLAGRGFIIVAHALAQLETVDISPAARIDSLIAAIDSTSSRSARSASSAGASAASSLRLRSRPADAKGQIGDNASRGSGSRSILDR
jgi:hypothetical protein